MAKTTIETQIQSRIESFTAELAQLIRQAALESVSEALTGSGMLRNSGRRAAGPAVRASSRSDFPSAAGKRSREEIDGLSERLLDFIRNNPGQRTEQIGSALGVPTKELVLPMRKLLREGQLKTKGQKRATAYYAK
jgi:hypothetical protein